MTYQAKRKPDDVPRLWRVFQLALRDAPLEDSDFVKAFDEACQVRGLA